MDKGISQNSVQVISKLENDFLQKIVLLAILIDAVINFGESLERTIMVVSVMRYVLNSNFG